MKYFVLLIWHIDDNLFCWKSVAFINDPTRNIYVVSFEWLVKSLVLSHWIDVSDLKEMRSNNDDDDDNLDGDDVDSK